MRCLLDTHTFLWFTNGSSELSEDARRIISDSENHVFLSIASLWEISIKTALGKLEIAGSYDMVIEDVTKNRIEILPINFAHTVKQNALPFHHRDPFDRMIVSQAIVENMDLISNDDRLDSYFLDQSIRRIW